MVDNRKDVRGRHPVQRTPFGDRVVLRVIQGEGQTTGGIILPDAATGKRHEGQAVALGRGRVLDSASRVAPEVKVGDRVAYRKTVTTRSRGATSGIS